MTHRTGYRLYHPEDGHEYDPIVNSRYYCAKCGYGSHMHTRRSDSRTEHAAAPEPENSEAAQSDLTSPRPSRHKLPHDKELSDYTNQELFDTYNALRRQLDLIAIETEKRFH